jgi:hypothetical protein
MDPNQENETKKTRKPEKTQTRKTRNLEVWVLLQLFFYYFFLLCFCTQKKTRKTRNLEVWILFQTSFDVFYFALFSGAAWLMAAVSDEIWFDLMESITHNRRQRSVRSHFGGPFIGIKKLFSFLSFASATALLQTLYFLKCGGPSWEVIASRFKIDFRTLRTNVWTTLEELDRCLPEVNFFLFSIVLILIFFNSLILKIVENIGHITVQVEFLILFLSKLKIQWRVNGSIIVGIKSVLE